LEVMENHIISTRHFKNIFKTPPVEYRGCTFWSLNDRLERGELERQLKEFKEGGMGGVFLHSREGLLTDYLSDEWFDLLGFAIEKADELGLKAWIYDEDKWPSGYAGGLVPQKSEAYRPKVLSRISVGQPLPENSTLLSSDEAFNYVIITATMGHVNFNGICYTDLMNPEAVDYFIETTYEKYKKRFSKYFGNVIPGFFTDEPCFRMNSPYFTQELNSFPYSPWAAKRYKQLYGEAFEKHIGKLFDGDAEAMKYRYRYYRALTIQFVESYTKRLAQWCADNNLLLTGHYMYEDTIESQSYWDGSVMAHLEHMQVPGMDHLCLDIKNKLTAKQCSGIANQQGKKIVMSEMFGGAGQNMTFEDRLWIGGWHAIMGINFVCHHLSHYSMRGCRKYDYPPTLSAHQPYWDKNSFVEDYQSRLACLMRNSTFKADFMVIHPDESGWCLQSGNGTRPEMSRLDRQLVDFIDEMFKIQRDFDFVNEDFLARNGKIENDGINVGQMKYRAIIVPAMVTIRESTLALLEKFHKSGGFIAVILPAPRLIYGEPAKVFDRLLKIAGTLVQDCAELEEVLNTRVPPDWQIEGKNTRDVFMQRREFDNEELFLLFNSSRKENAKIQFSKDGKWTEYLLENGNIQDVAQAFELAPAQIRAFLFKPGDPIKTDKNQSASETVVELNKTWEFECAQANILPLDFACWSTDSQNWTEARPVFGICEELQLLNYCGPLYLRFEFEAQKLHDVKLFYEELLSNCEVKLNGQILGFENSELLRSPMICAPIDDFLYSGMNTIELALDYIQGDRRCFDNVDKRYGTELESIYLVGNFGVFNHYTKPAGNLPVNLFDDNWNHDLPERRLIRIGNPVQLKAMPEFSTDGELTTAGLPFYAGAVHLKQIFLINDLTGCFKLRFKQLDAINAQVKINGHEVPKLFCCQPLEADISGMLKTGENQLEVVLTNSLRNFLGPHHLAIGETVVVGPRAFGNRDFYGWKISKKTDWAVEKNRKRLISWIDDYYVVRFGLHETIKIIKICL
jgi:hypothetical protein